MFHTVGDTGGIDNAWPQQIVAYWMEKDAAQQFPAFFYHLGDVVYYDGEHGSYYPQFYEPYFHYPAPIFAIPGNHDADVGRPPNHASLEPFMKNFCWVWRWRWTKDMGENGYRLPAFGFRQRPSCAVPVAGLR